MWPSCNLLVQLVLCCSLAAIVIAADFHNPPLYTLYCTIHPACNRSMPAVFPATPMLVCWPGSPTLLHTTLALPSFAWLNPPFNTVAKLHPPTAAAAHAAVYPPAIFTFLQCPV